MPEAVALRIPRVDRVALPAGCAKPVRARLRVRMLGWLMGLEPTTTGITIRDSTN